MKDKISIEDETAIAPSTCYASLTHGSLFSGIGGFDLASEWMGWENIFHCEWNDFGKRILKYYWPNAISYDDITKTDFTIHRGKIDILTGGFPCQPYSTSGKRLGKEDERHLWPEMLRAIREIKPKYIVGENVLGLVNWNGGLVFEEVQANLEAEGYEVQPVILPACSVGAPHRRERVWFVAYSNECTKESSRTSNWIDRKGSENNDESKKWRTEAEQYSGSGDVQRTNPNTESKQSERNELEQRKISKQKQRESGRNGGKMGNERNVADTQCLRQQEQRKYPGSLREETLRKRKASWAYDDGRWPTQSPICNGNDGISERLDTSTISRKQWNEESIKGGGNAIVPQVALQIFKAVAMHNASLSEA